MVNAGFIEGTAKVVRLVCLIVIISLIRSINSHVLLNFPSFIDLTIKKSELRKPLLKREIYLSSRTDMLNIFLSNLRRKKKLSLNYSAIWSTKIN